MPTTEDIHALAKHYGGKCLTKEYVTGYALMWMCVKGHTWDSQLAIVKQGGWCPACAKQEAHREKYMSRLKEFVEKKGGKCLTDDYENSNTKILFQCALGHKWWSTSPSIIKQGSWCHVCREEQNRKTQLEELRGLARNLGGQLLSEEYKEMDSKLKWRCKNNHVFFITAHIAKQGHWCMECYKAKIKDEVYTKLNVLAIKKGGKCLSESYKGDRIRMKWQCKDGHIWSMLPPVILRGRWCKKCSRAKACQVELESIKSFAIKKGGTCLSDCYVNNYTALKFKCNKGHTWNAKPSNILREKGSWCPECAREVRKEKVKSEVKIPSLKDLHAIAKKNGGRLLSKEYRGAELPLKWECSQKHIWSGTFRLIKSGGWCLECTKSKRMLGIEDLQGLARKNGGQLLSKKYTNSQTKMSWKCAKGHVFQASWNALYRGGWCRECVIERRKNSIVKYQELAKEHGGILLSKIYYDAAAKLEWQCKDGHTWFTTPFIVQMGSWCPACANERKRKACRNS